MRAAVVVMLAGCAASAVEKSADDAAPPVFDGAADSAARPTPQGALAAGASAEGSFGDSARYLAWTFTAAAGDVVSLDAAGVGNVDPVLAVYVGRDGTPSGAAIASNDDCDRGTFDSCVELTAPSAAQYVAVVRTYLTSGSGTVRVSLAIRGSGASPSGLEDTFERPEVGMLTDAQGRRCTATLVDPRYVLTAAHCVQSARPPETLQGSMRGTFRIDRGPGDSVTFDVDAFAAFGDDTDLALVRLTRSVSAGIARPATLATRAPEEGEPLVRLGYGCTDPVTRAGAGIKHAFRYTAGGDGGQTCPGDSGGPTFGPAGLTFTVSGESERGERLEIEVYDWLEQLRFKLGNWTAQCAPGAGWVPTCDGDDIQQCWLGYTRRRPCRGECRPGDFEGEEASCSEDIEGPPTSMTFSSTGAPIAIPDLDATGIHSDIVVGDVRTIDELHVTFEITHTFPYDLSIVLSHDGGPEVVIASEVAVDGPAFTQTVPLTAFAGDSLAGTWRLTVRDNARVDVGTLDRWSMDVVAH